MKQYRDLTDDDVLQEGDECCPIGDDEPWYPVDARKFGYTASCFLNLEFRRPPSPAEITAAERVKFEEKAASEPMITPLDRFDDYDYLPEERNVGEYEDLVSQLCWEFWCAAVNCDPMGDVGNG